MFLAFWTHSQLLSPQPCGSLVESVCHQLVEAACLVGIEPLRAACPITQAHDEEHGQENRERCGEHQSSLSSSASSPKHKIVSTGSSLSSRRVKPRRCEVATFPDAVSVTTRGGSTLKPAALISCSWLSVFWPVVET